MPEKKDLPYHLPLQELLRPVLIRYAYGICGSVAEAEDVVQDLFLYLLDRDLTGVDDLRAYLIRSVINRAIDRKKALIKRVESYPGTWLPEPFADDTADRRLLSKEKFSYALMVLLEHLDPRQRAVFILKEAFSYSHEEIAAVLDCNAALSRQLLSRARKQLASVQREDERMASGTFLSRYLDVMQSGNTAALEKLLLEDIIVISDGGGKAAAALNPVIGVARVTALLFGIYKKFALHCELRTSFVNGSPALLYLSEGQLIKCQILTIEAGRISRIYIIRNPDKLLKISF
ncbi:sigma-70 family RNA polymerase sigma factor [Pedobacter sp. SYP-B3415]|uniref:sigma-70 family RNA polymerase sigma factor n=1 Tax=Pedobacter sp. SYP-B3415 TaxID=2496641 RepID=UPI00101C25F9|nr:sigma-70 family RNA polymerase sigma factor [Pedobacter sp. SYP-B3415]